ncbi:MAG TPA: expansin EXLX1 family cellulose-binding protein [Polyangiaceae bacterium]|nr:expansin EXLX1 family cellulose-binding protein [Polyangiaceae bacterium]
MTMPSWWQPSRLLVAVLPWVPFACAPSSGPAPGDDAASAGRPAGTGGSGSGSAGQTSTGSAGAKGGSTSTGGSVGTGGSSNPTTGGSSGTGGTLSTGGSATTTGGTGGTGLGAAGLGTTGGSGGSGGSAGGSGGSGAMSGTGGSTSMAGQGATGGGMTDPCASVTCGTGQTCSNGTCMCMTGTLCSGSCVDTTSDANNCGTCGTKCDSGGACVDGKCVNPMCDPDTATRNGHVTHYSLATSMVACHYPTSSLPQYYGAMNEYDWNNSGVCGACVEITNGGNKLTLQIVDECPYKGNEMWCYQGSHHIDLNPAASDALNANSNPAVTWKFVPCMPKGNINYYFDSASQQYYLAVTPMNYENLVAKMEVKKGGTFTALNHTDYNTYELTDGAGTGMLTFRLTDIYNHVVVDTVNMNPGQIVNGNVQFAACP